MDSDKSFIFFSNTTTENCCNIALPVSKGGDIAFHSSLASTYLFLIDLAGNTLGELYVDGFGFVDLSSFDLSKIMAKGDCFRLHSEQGYSNIFQYIGCDTDDTLLFEYWNTEDEHWSVRLPAKLKYPQSKKEKSEYTDSNGQVISLSKTIRKEYEFESDFLPEWVHDAIQNMLLYPNLLINDIPVYESGDYEIDWENSDENNYAKAETEFAEQDINRYSICDE